MPLPDNGSYTETVQLDRCFPHPDSPFRHTGDHVEDIRHSLREFGYIRRIVVTPADEDMGPGTFYVLAGRAVLPALMLEGVTEAEATVIPAHALRPGLEWAYIRLDNIMALAGLQDNQAVVMDLAGMIDAADQVLVTGPVA